MEKVALSKAERTRQMIIERSAHLFNQKGYAGTSMQDIMAATGLTKGGIYGNFETKEEIAMAAFEYATGHITRLIADKLVAHTSATKQFDALIGFYKSYLVNPPITGGCPVLNMAVEADDTNPNLRMGVIKVLRRLHKSVVSIVQLGITQGEFKDTADADRFAVLFISSIEGGIMMSKAYGDTMPMHIVLQHLEKVIQLELKV